MEYLTSCQAKQQTEQAVIEKHSTEIQEVVTQVNQASLEGKYSVKLENKILADEVQVYLIEKLGYRLIPGYDDHPRGVGNPVPYTIVDWNNPIGC